MVKAEHIFSGFSVRDIDEARTFYTDVLGLTIGEEMGSLSVDIGNGARVFVYPKRNHEPAGFTVLNLDVADIDVAVAELEAAGVEMLRYPGMKQDEHGIARPPAGSGGGPDIAWFTDPSGNIFSVLKGNG